jgi:hypothetical protein
VITLASTKEQPMPASKISWRIFPPPGIPHLVRQLAIKENRSVANMVLRLAAEGLDSRRIANAAQNGEMQKLVAMLATATAAPAKADA